MRKIKYKMPIIGMMIMLAACEDRNEDITNAVNKSGAIETAIHVAHINSERDEMITTHKIWVKNDVYKTVEYRDTLPSLGTQMTEAENEEGDTRQVTVPKDYEIYITVK
jgi:hypothetical protein